MSIDGTYGRLSAHNQRFKELRRKKLERREKKIWKNSLKSTHRGQSKNEKNLDSIDAKKLELIKIEIRKKAKAKLRKELFIYLISFVITGVLTYYLFFR